jgi:4-hydroxybutyrate CoA-transferase
MNNWEDIYKSRIKTPEEAISIIQSRQKVLLAPFCSEPQTLIEELVCQKGRLEYVYLYNMVLGSPCVYADPECFPHFHIRTFLASPNLKDAFLQGHCDYIPINLSRIPQWLKNEEIDVALVQVTPPNDQGYCSLGISVDFVQAAIHHGKYVIAQVNDQMPWTYGDTLVSVDAIHAFVPSSRPLISIPKGKSTEAERKIGEYVAELIPDRATFQVGIGSIADSVLEALQGKQDLGVHTGTFSDGMIDLVNRGAITNEYKAIHRGKIVSTSLTGTERLYQFVHKNPLVELYPANYTHHAKTLSQLEQFHTVNSALEVDLTGQINAEQLGPYPIAGVGGQMDFIRGAQMSNGGKSIIALPSTAKNGTRSRIAATVSEVTSLKSEVDYVVTEYGVASLFGKSLKDRAKELIKVAHPKFRDELQFSLKT